MNITPLSGVVFLDKPEGWTSRQAVNAVRRVFSSLSSEVASKGKRRALKAGHAGTLDPLATGMLPVLVGEATRFADCGLLADKRYQVTIDLSLQTDTLDAEGEVLARFTRQPAESAIDALLSGMCGEIQQVPPAYSAIRIDGKRSHQLARQGKAVKLAARPVTIHSLHKTHYDYPVLTLEVHCSKGTYIRSLARDMGEALGCGGCVRVLRRISTAGWSAELMCSMQMLEASPLDQLHSMAFWLADWPRLDLDDDLARRFVQGQRLAMNVGGQHAGEVAVYGAGSLLGTGCMRQREGRLILHPKTVLPSAQRALAC